MCEKPSFFQVVGVPIIAAVLAFAIVMFIRWAVDL